MEIPDLTSFDCEWDVECIPIRRSEWYLFHLRTRVCNIQIQCLTQILTRRVGGRSEWGPKLETSQKRLTFD